MSPRKWLSVALLASVSLGAMASPAAAGPLVFPLLLPLLGNVALWGTSIGLSLGAVTGLVTAVSYGIQLGLGIGLSYLGNKIFAPKAPKPEERQVLVRESVTPRVRHYGRVKVSGVLTYTAASGGYLYRVITTGTGEIDAVEEHWVDDTHMTIDGTGLADSGTKYWGRIKMDARLGTASQTAYADLVAAIPADWTSAHQGNGMSHVLMTLLPIAPKYFPSIYPRGEPNYRQVIRGSKVYDPRQSAHDLDDPSTWTWSDNAALVIADYLTHADGMRLPAEFIDYDALAVAANICDEAVPLAAGGSVARYRIWNTYGFDERPADVLARFLIACDGQIMTSAEGLMQITVGKWVEPDVVIDDDAIISYQDFSRGRSTVESANVLKSRYLSPLHDYQSADADPWRNEADIAARGELVTTNDFICAPHHSQARRLMKIAAARLSPSWTGSLTCNLRGLAVMGRRFIHVRFSELEIDESFEVNGDPELVFGEGNTLMGVRFGVSAMPASTYDWDAATEEGEAPAVVGDITTDSGVEDMDNLSASVEQRVVSGGQAVAVAVITWDAPVNTALRPEIEIKLASGGAGDWLSIPVGDEQSQTETGVLLDGEDYDIRGRFRTPSGTPGDWSAEITVTAVADVTAPANVTNVDASGGTSEVDVSFRTPNDVHFVKARTYRNSVNNAGTATLVQDDYCAANADVVVTVDSVPPGSWYHWVAAANGSNVEASKVAAATNPVAVVGPDLISNGTFASDTVWSKGADWTISGGVAVRAAGAGESSLSQPVTLTAGGTYEITFTVLGYAAGTVTPRFSGGSNVDGTARSANGTYTESLVAASGNTTFNLVANAAGDFSIDTVSVIQTA